MVPALSGNEITKRLDDPLRRAVAAYLSRSSAAPSHPPTPRALSWPDGHVNVPT